MSREGFEREITRISESRSINLDEALFSWFSESVKAPSGYKATLISPPTGGVSLILTNKKKAFLVGGTFGKASDAQINEFFDTAQNWGDKAKFKKWLLTVGNQEAKRSCRRAFSLIRKRLLGAEFLSLDDFNAQWTKNVESTIDPDEGVEGRILNINDIVYFYSLSRAGATFTEDLSLRAVNGQALTYEGVKNEKGVVTYVCIFQIPELLGVLEKQDDSEILFSRNVRLEIPDSPVNESIAETYKKESGEFFYGNNGIHIVATMARLEGSIMTIRNPAIINGGQTLRTLLETGVRHKGMVLARITVISEKMQTKIQWRRFIDNIIFRANSNNEMKPWDLRSNDPMQVEIAQEFLERGIYYERKSYEWGKARKQHPRIKYHISSILMAQITFLANPGWGPVKLRKIGQRPLFTKTKQGDFYSQVFRKVCADYDRAESKARIFLLAKKSVKTASGVPEKVKSFKTASLNFVFSILWKVIERESPIHPITPPIRRSEGKTLFSRWEREIGKTVSELYRLFRGELRTGEINQNDLFRSETHWKRALAELDKAPRRKRLRELVKSTTR